MAQQTNVRVYESIEYRTNEAQIPCIQMPTFSATLFSSTTIRYVGSFALSLTLTRLYLASLTTIVIFTWTEA